MKLNNSFKLAVANFALFWKIALYKIIAFGISALFVLPIFSILKNAFTTSGFVNIVVNMFTSNPFKSTQTVMTNLLNLFQSFFEGINILLQNNLFVFIYFIIVILIVLPFFLKLSEVPASESAYSYMSSLSKNSYSSNFVSLIGKSSSYSILRSLMEIPFIILIVAGFYGILLLATKGGAWEVFAPLFLFAFSVMSFSLVYAFFNGWAPSIVVFNECPVKAFLKGLKAVKRNFFSVLSSFIVVMTIVIAILYLFGIYAFIVIVPLLSLILAVFGQVLFFESQGMDYYVSPDKIIIPRKLETADNIKKVKDII